MIIGIVAGGLSNRIHVENLVPLGLDKKTKYYKFRDGRAYSYGPPALGEVPYLDNLRVWEAYQEDDTIILKNTDMQHVMVQGVRGTLNSISFTFDQNGYPLIIWEENKELFLRWYDPVVSDTVTTNLGYGYSPFIALETFNENLKPSRVILLVYINEDNQLVHRYQTDRWGEEFLIKDDVIDIIGFGPTNHNNLKIVYVNNKNEQDEFEIGTIATERLGLYEFDTLHARNVGAQLDAVTYTDSVALLEPPVERPLHIEVLSASSEIGNFFTYENISKEAPVELPLNVGIISASSTITIRTDYQRVRVQDVVEGKLEISPEIISMTINNSSITRSSEDVVDRNLELIPEIQFIDIISDYQPSESELDWPQWSFNNRNPGINLSNDRESAFVTDIGGVDGIVKSVVTRNSFKRYVEIEITELDFGTSGSVGIARSSANLGGLAERNNDTWELFTDGTATHGGVDTPTPNLVVGDIIGIAIDVEAGKLWWSRNDTWFTGNPNTGANPFYENLTIDDYTIICAPMVPGVRFRLRVPQTEWEYNAPEDFGSWDDNTTVPLTIVGEEYDGINLENYNLELTCLNAEGDVYWTILSGSLPKGLHLNSISAKDALISGVPDDNAGYYPVKIRAEDSVGKSTTKTLEIVIEDSNGTQPAPILTINGSLPQAAAHLPYSSTSDITVTGTGVLTIDIVNGILPEGCNIELVGEHVKVTSLALYPGFYSFTIGVMDEDDNEVFLPLTLEVKEYEWMAGEPVNESLYIGPGPYTSVSISEGILPSGLDFELVDQYIKITGTPDGSIEYGGIEFEVAGPGPVTLVKCGYVISRLWKPSDSGLPMITWLDKDSDITTNLSGRISRWSSNTDDPDDDFRDYSVSSSPTSIVENFRYARFDHNSHRLDNTTPTNRSKSANTESIWALALYRRHGLPTAPNNSPIIWIAKGDDTSSRFLLRLGSSEIMNIPDVGGRRLDSDDFSASDNSVETPLNTWTLVTGICDYSSNTISFRKDGVLLSHRTDAWTEGGPTSATTSQTRTTIGNRVSTVADGAQIDLASLVVFYGEPPTENVILRAEGWNAYMYDMRNLLLSTHPYKKEAPKVHPYLRMERTSLRWRVGENVNQLVKLTGGSGVFKQLEQLSGELPSGIAVTLQSDNLMFAGLVTEPIGSDSCTVEITDSNDDIWELVISWQIRDGFPDIDF